MYDSSFVVLPAYLIPWLPTGSFGPMDNLMPVYCMYGIALVFYIETLIFMPEFMRIVEPQLRCNNEHYGGLLCRLIAGYKDEIMEGLLSKWTNVMKGWQFRWFVLDENTGLLSYYTIRQDEDYCELLAILSVENVLQSHDYVLPCMI